MSNNGFIIPYYIYPDATSNSRLVGLVRRYTTVPVIIIVNAASGPGTVRDDNYAAEINLLLAAGARVIGYVDTDYGNRPEADVEADVSAWGALYPDAPLSGIFFDRMAADPSFIDQYSSYAAFAQTDGFALIVGNPGVVVAAPWYVAIDLIVVAESDAWPLPTALTVGPWAAKAVLVHSMPTLDLSTYRTVCAAARWVYATDDTIYDSLTLQDDSGVWAWG